MWGMDPSHTLQIYKWLGNYRFTGYVIIVFLRLAPPEIQSRTSHKP